MVAELNFRVSEWKSGGIPKDERHFEVWTLFSVFHSPGQEGFQGLLRPWKLSSPLLIPNGVAELRKVQDFGSSFRSLRHPLENSHVQARCPWFHHGQREIIWNFRDIVSFRIK